MNIFRITLNKSLEVMNPVRFKLSNIVSSSLAKGINSLAMIPTVFIELLITLVVFSILLV